MKPDVYTVTVTLTTLATAFTAKEAQDTVMEALAEKLPSSSVKIANPVTKPTINNDLFNTKISYLVYRSKEVAKWGNDNESRPRTSHGDPFGILVNLRDYKGD